MRTTAARREHCRAWTWFPSEATQGKFSGDKHTCGSDATRWMLAGGGAGVLLARRGMLGTLGKADSAAAVSFGADFAVSKGEGVRVRVTAAEKGAAAKRVEAGPRGAARPLVVGGRLADARCCCCCAAAVMASWRITASLLSGVVGRREAGTWASKHGLSCV